MAERKVRLSLVLMAIIIRAQLVKFGKKIEHENNQHVVYDFFFFAVMVGGGDKSEGTNVATMRTLEILPRQI